MLRRRDQTVRSLRVEHYSSAVNKQAMGGDGGLHLGLGDRVGRRLAHVLGRKRQPAQRNLPVERFVQGGDVIHANLPRYRDEKDGTGAAETALSGRPAPRPDPARLRLLAGLLRGLGGDGGTAAAVPGGVSGGAAGGGRSCPGRMPRPGLRPGRRPGRRCPSSKQMGLLSVFHKGGSGSSLFDVKPLGFDGSSGGFGWSVF